MTTTISTTQVGSVYSSLKARIGPYFPEGNTFRKVKRSTAKSIFLFLQTYFLAVTGMERTLGCPQHPWPPSFPLWHPLSSSTSWIQGKGLGLKKPNMGTQ